MELDEFVSETLRQILAGVTKAQQGETGGNINAAFAGVASGNLIDGGNYGLFTRVDFDVAVTAETAGGGKASIKVWGLGAEGGGEKRSQTASRVSFTVPVRLPAGDQSKAEELRRRAEAASSARSSSWVA
jgi:hypothetical protein